MQMGTAILNLQWPLPLVQGVAVLNHLRVQVNDTPLVPQDRLCLGGRFSVRGFDGRQVLCGDRGYVSRNDLVWALDESVSLYGGVDLGQVDGRSAKDLPSRFMAGYVAGVRAQYRFPNALRLSLDAFAGRPIIKPSFLTTASTSAGFSVSLSF